MDEVEVTRVTHEGVSAEKVAAGARRLVPNSERYLELSIRFDIASSSSILPSDCACVCYTTVIRAHDQLQISLVHVLVHPFQRLCSKILNMTLTPSQITLSLDIIVPVSVREMQSK